MKIFENGPSGAKAQLVFGFYVGAEAPTHKSVYAGVEAAIQKSRGHSSQVLKLGGREKKVGAAIFVVMDFAGQGYTS